MTGNSKTPDVIEMKITDWMMLEAQIVTGNKNSILIQSCQKDNPEVKISWRFYQERDFWLSPDEDILTKITPDFYIITTHEKIYHLKRTQVIECDLKDKMFLSKVDGARENAYLFRGVKKDGSWLNWRFYLREGVWKSEDNETFQNDGDIIKIMDPKNYKEYHLIESQ
jgi:hypothetical protein